ncbi:MAG: hypothetical protein C0582_02495 [Alphaproteobacteria bacterium]|nr:MAG: hypothetical protein C0582_02495 [Alphaproteobacteria bacterium]
MGYFRIFLTLLTFVSFFVQAAKPGEASPAEDNINFIRMSRAEQDVPLTFCKNLRTFYQTLGQHCLYSIAEQVNTFYESPNNQPPVTETALQNKIAEANQSLTNSMIATQKFTSHQISEFTAKQKAILNFIKHDFSPEFQESTRLTYILTQAISNNKSLKKTDEITSKSLAEIGLENDFLTETRTLYQNFLNKLAQRQCLLISDLWTVVQFFYKAQDVYVGTSQMRTYPQLLNLLNDFPEKVISRDDITQVSIPFHKEFYRDDEEYTLDQYNLLEKTSASQLTLSEALYLEENYTCHSVFELPSENSPFSPKQLSQFKKDVQKDGCVFSPRNLAPIEGLKSNIDSSTAGLSALFYNKGLPVQNAVHWLSQGQLTIPQDPKDFKYLTFKNLFLITDAYELAKNTGSINDELQLLSTIQKNVEKSKKSFLESMEEHFNEINDFEKKFQTLLAQIKEAQPDKKPVEALRKELEKFKIQLKKFDSNLKRSPLLEQEKKWNEAINDFSQHIEQLKKNDPESFASERMKKFETQKEEAAEVKEKRLSIDEKKQTAQEQLKRIEDEFKKLEASYLHKAQEIADRNAAELLAELAEEAHSKQSKKSKHKAKRKAEAEAKHQAEEESRQAAEAEARRQAEAKRKAEAEEEAKRKAAEAEADASRKARDTKRKSKAKAKRKAEAEAKRQEEEKARQAAEAETRHQAEAKRKAEEETKRKAAKAEADGKSKADAEKRLAEEEALLVNRIQQALLEKKREAEEAAAQKEKKPRSATSQRRALPTQEPRFRSHGNVGPITPAEADHTHQRQGERLRL